MTTASHTLTTSHLTPARTWSLARTAHTDASVSQALLRITLALVLLPHGAQHLLGAFGGYGFQGTVNWMTATLGVPAAIAGFSILVEFFGPILLLFGIGARPVALLLAGFLTVAGTTHIQNGFFMNWFGTRAAGSEGFEYHLLAIAMAVAVIGRGAGAFSLDRWVAQRQQQ